MNDEKHTAGEDTVGATRPLGDELFSDAPTEPVGHRGHDETLVLPAAPAPSGTVPSGTGPAGTAAGSSTAPGGTAPADGRSRGPRVATIVWGFVLVALGAAVLAGALGARVDVGLATIVVLGAAGVTLVVGSVVAGARRRRP
ncbi:hypothetical protein [Cellulosimicrobium marinum]|uniref:hypothetical protein n=1 Tax=Cellulosimicrobium marinum TaxID=1638992 RepID=UPI001E559D47|nr:hypothetical protein [Cellulosimicrobium marinum]MCB7136688.1 hypothetical protein [Cellulosimicrobium marinum]